MDFKLNFRFRCLFPQMALLSNSCLSNCRCLHRDSGSIRGLEIRTQIAIKEGTELAIQYNALVLGHRKRRELFRMGQSKIVYSFYIKLANNFFFFKMSKFRCPARSCSKTDTPDASLNQNVLHRLYLHFGRFFGPYE